MYNFGGYCVKSQLISEVYMGYKFTKSSLLNEYFIHNMATLVRACVRACVRAEE